MPDFPFYHDKQEGRDDVTSMTALEKKQADQDWEDAKYMIEYRKNSGWDEKAIRGQKIYNVVQTAKPDDDFSRIFLGYSRTQIDKGIEQMTEGEPGFGFERGGPSDQKKVIIWKNLVKKVLSDCNYRVHQKLFFRDYFVMGSGVFEVFLDYPQRTIRVPNSASETGFDEVIVRDHRRPKVGIRALNPLACWRNPNISDSTAVPSCLKKRILTWNQFANDFGRAELDDGTKKYKNLEKIAKGSHVCIYEYQDEIRDVLRLYATSFGNESDGMAKSPQMEDFGIMIFDKSLKIHEIMKEGIVSRCEGLNAQGMCNMRWGTYFDAYDRNWSGQHAVYGMGLPERIEGEDMILQTMFNMHIDNTRWANTFALNYKGNSADSYIDLDANRLYGGELIDGEITPMALGASKPADFQALKNVLDESVIPATGINHQQMTGDTSKTLGEFALRIKMANRSAQQRLKGLEDEVFKPVGAMLLSGALTELTVDEYEDMTEQQVEAARENIKSGVSTIEDYEDLNGSAPKKKRMQYVKIPGVKIREDFSSTKKRKLQYNSSDNTLVFDETMEEKDSFIPLVKEYVYPLEYVESGLLPDVTVDSRSMLSDEKVQRVQDYKDAVNFLIEISQLGWKGADFDKIAAGIIDFAEVDPQDLLADDTQDTGSNERKALLEQMKNIIQPSPIQNAQAAQPMATPSNAGGLESLQGAQGDPAGVLGQVAQGAV